MNLILRPFTPPCAFAYWKYAFSAFGIAPYSAAGPVSGNVPPIVIVDFVTPGVAVLAANATETRVAATASTTRASAPFILLVICPPCLGDCRNVDRFGIRNARTSAGDSPHRAVGAP